MNRLGIRWESSASPLRVLVESSASDQHQGEPSAPTPSVPTANNPEFVRPALDELFAIQKRQAEELARLRELFESRLRSDDVQNRSLDRLLDELQAIERAHARVRAERWGPRTLDLDILLYGQEVLDDERLVVPHPGIAARAFVLLPLNEIAPDLLIPGLGTPAALLAQLPLEGISRL